MIFDSAPPDRVTPGPCFPPGGQLLKAATSRAIRTAEAVKRKSLVDLLAYNPSARAFIAGPASSTSG